MSIFQRFAIGAALLAGGALWMFQSRHTSELNEQIRAFQQEQRAVAERFARLEEALDKAKRQVEELRDRPQATSAEPTESAARRLPRLVPADSLPSVGLEDEIDRACDEPSPGKREAALQRIIRSISASDIPRALAHLATRSGMKGVETPLFKELTCKWGESSPAAALAWANGLSDAGAQKAALVGIFNGWTHVSPEAAADSAARLPAGDLQDAVVLKVVNEWGFRDPSNVAAWVSTFSEGPLRDKALEPLIFWGQGQCPAAIVEMLDTINNADLTKKYGETLASIWLNRDPAAARLWIERSPLDDEVKRRLIEQANKQK